MAMWRMVSRLSDKQLQAAFEYLLKTAPAPSDEQINPADRKEHIMIAAQCVALVLENRRKVREGEL